MEKTNKEDSMADEQEVTVWYLSKTLWVNAIALVAMIAQGVTGHVLINMELQATILGVVNMILRLITKKPIVWS